MRNSPSPIKYQKFSNEEVKKDEARIRSNIKALEEEISLLARKNQELSSKLKKKDIVSSKTPSDTKEENKQFLSKLKSVLNKTASKLAFSVKDPFVKSNYDQIIEKLNQKGYVNAKVMDSPSTKNSLKSLKSLSNRPQTPPKSFFADQKSNSIPYSNNERYIIHQATKKHGNFFPSFYKSLSLGNRKNEEFLNN